MSQLVVSISGRELQLQHKPINLVQTDGDRELLLDSVFEESFSVQHDLSNKMQYCKTYSLNITIIKFYSYFRQGNQIVVKLIN